MTLDFSYFCQLNAESFLTWSLTSTVEGFDPLITI